MAERFPEQFDGPLPTPKSRLAQVADKKRERQEFWHLVFLYDRMTPEEKEEFGLFDRVVMGYRICRHLCRIKGILGDDEPLCATVGHNPSPWTHAVISSPPEEQEDLSEESKKPALEMPSPIYPPEDDEDESFEAFYTVAEETARRLQLYSYSAFGTRFLVDPKHRPLWPRPYTILAYEHRLLGEITSIEMKNGQVAVRDELIQRGFLAWEIESLIKISRHVLVRNVLMSTEEARAVLALRIEDLIQRARKPDGADIRAELAALKLMAWLHGLHKTEPDDGLSEAVDIVKNEEIREKKGKVT